MQGMTWDQFRDYYAACAGGKVVKFPLLVANWENFDEFSDFLRQVATRYPDDYFHVWAVYPRAGLVAVSIEVGRITAAESFAEMLADGAMEFSANFRLQLEEFIVRLREVHRQWLDAGAPSL